MADQDPFASITHKYEVHPESYEFVRRSQALGLKPLHSVSIEETRRKRSEVVYSLTGVVDFPGKETEIIVPSPYSTEGIPVTVYKPSSCPEKPAILVYFHGGGFVLGSRKSHETAVKILSRDSGAIFVNVEYRLLPRDTEKIAPFEDAEVVTRWVLENRVTVGGHSESRVGAIGDSAGGQLALSVVNALPGQLDFQVLIYPVSDVSGLTEYTGSRKEFTDTPGLNADALKFLYQHSIAQMSDPASNPIINAAVAPNVDKSPPALMLLAELDPLRDMGLAHVERLRTNGVAVECHVITGVVHAFFSQADTFKTKCAESYALIVAFINKFQ